MVCFIKTLTDAQTVWLLHRTQVIYRCLTEEFDPRDLVKARDKAELFS